MWRVLYKEMEVCVVFEGEISGLFVCGVYF